MSLINQLVKKRILDKGKATTLEFEIRETGKREEEVILERRIVDENFLFNLKSKNLKYH